MNKRWQESICHRILNKRMFLQRNMSENAGLPLDKCLDKTLESHDFTVPIIILYFVTEMSI